jgi:saccharopine dehydrogenase (NADP+, L-glutamate forming)
MHKVLVLGAGLVSKPLVRYLLEQPDFHVKVASRTVSKAEKLIDDHPDGEAESLNVKDTAALGRLVQEADLVVSLLPYIHHVTVAEFCLEHRKNMVTTSYVSPAMRKLDSKAKELGLLILNEIGVDPGIDHMSAMKVIHRVQNAGGEITSFRSFCGGLPAPEANTNPYGYKFSWSPQAVLLAGKNSGRYLEDGKEINIPGEDLFDNYWPIKIEGIGDLEYYINRDSIPYMETYGIQTTKTMFRGTLRYPGWCQTLKKMVEVGLLDEAQRKDVKGLTFAQFVAKLIGSSASANLKKDLASYLEIEEDSEVIKRFEWLGLLSDKPLPLEKGSAMDILGELMLEKMPYKEGERDMIILQHEFVAEYPKEKRKEKIFSTLIDFGIPYGDSSMSRTVSLPAAIGAKLVLEGKIDATGVHIPVSPTIYEPILKELERLGIAFKERSEKIK